MDNQRAAPLLQSTRFVQRQSGSSDEPATFASVRESKSSLRISEAARLIHDSERTQLRAFRRLIDASPSELAWRVSCLRGLRANREPESQNVTIVVWRALRASSGRRACPNFTSFVSSQEPRLGRSDCSFTGSAVALAMKNARTHGSTARCRFRNGRGREDRPADWRRPSDSTLGVFAIG